MARTFNGSTQYLLRTNAAGIASLPITMAVWYYNASDTGGTEHVFGIGDASEVDDFCTINVRWGDTGNPAGAFLHNTAPNPLAVSSTGLSTSTWHHIAAVFTDGGTTWNAAVYLDGGSSGTDSQTKNTFSAAGWDRIAFGQSADGTPSFGAGTLAHGCIWDVALTAGEIAALAAGAHPLSIRPASLKVYAPLGENTTGNVVDVIRGDTYIATASPGYVQSPHLHAIGSPIFVRGQAVSATNINATTDALTLTENAASLALNINANVDTLTLTEYASTLAQNITTTVDALTLTEHAAVVSVGSVIAANVDTLTLTEYQASLAVNVTTNVDTLNVTTYPATIGYAVNVATNVVSLSLTTYAATIEGTSITTKGGGPSQSTINRKRLLKQLQYDDEQVLALYLALRKRRRR